MSSELSFTRKASGLTRGFSTSDLFVLGLMFIQPCWGIYMATVYGLALFPGANLLIALGLSFVTVGVFGPLMWGDVQTVGFEFTISNVKINRERDA